MKNNKSIEDLLNSSTDIDISLLEQFSEYAPLSKDNEKRIIELGLKKLNKENSHTDSEAVIIENPHSKFINFKRFTAVAASVLIILGVGFSLANVLNKNDLPLTGTSVSTKDGETTETTAASEKKGNDLNYRSVKDIQNQKLYCLTYSGDNDSVYTGLSEITNVFRTDDHFVLFGTNDKNELIIETSENFSNFYLHKDFLICSSGEIKSVIQKNNDTFIVYYIDYKKSENTLCRMEANISSETCNTYECSLINNSNLSSCSDILEIFEPDDSSLLLIMSDRVIKLEIKDLFNSSLNNFDIYQKTIYSTDKNIIFSFTDYNNRFSIIVSDSNKLQLVTFKNFNKKKSSHVDYSLKLAPDKVSGFSAKINNSKYDFVYKENGSIWGYSSKNKKSEIISSSDIFSDEYSVDNIIIENNNNIYYIS